MRILYVICAIGWLLGLLALRGRARVLAAAAATSFVAYLAYSTVYLLLLNAVWVPPIPIYLEHSLCALYIAGAAAGYWGVLLAEARLTRRVAAAVSRAVAHIPRPVAPEPPLSPLFGITRVPRSPLFRSITLVVALILVGIVPAKVADYARNESGPRAEIYYQPWPNEPELMHFLAQRVSSDVGQPIRGSLAFWTFREDIHTIHNAWAHGMHTINEYSQLVSPQAVYFLPLAYLKQNEVLGSINGFVPLPGPSWESFAKAMQLFGMRYSHR
jgi:hypothetical protein